MGRTPNKFNEPVAYAEIESVLHRNAGNAKVKTYTSVNKPVKVDSSVDAQRIGKVRVEMHVKEDRNVNGDCIYEKNISLKQIRDDGEPTSRDDYEETDCEDEPKSPLSKVEHCLKNMIDNLWADARETRNHVIAIAIIAGLALMGSVIALWRIFA